MSLFCEVPDCNRRGAIELLFPAQHDAAERVNERALICAYHGGMYVEELKARGHAVQVQLSAPPKVALNRTRRPHRYVQRRPHDNTE